MMEMSEAQSGTVRASLFGSHAIGAALPFLVLLIIGLALPLFAGEGGLPIGAQFVGPPGRDGRLMRTARALVATLGAADKSQRKRARG